MAQGSAFTKVFSRRVNKAAVKTDKAEEKLLDDDQYVPPPGHLGFIKGLITNPDGSQGSAQFVSIGGSRMDEVRTWNHAGEIFSRRLDWIGQSREKRLQKCSKCKNTGHNSLNKNCPVNIDLSEMVEDAVEDQMDITVTGEQDEFEENVDQGEEDLADIDELLFSDDDLF